MERGYVASRAYLPEQDLGDETLSIVVVEGELEAIVMNDEPGKHDRLIGAAFPGLLGRPINLRELEQGLEQLNRLRSNAIGGTVGIRLGVEWLAIELSYGELLLVSQGLLDDGGHPGGRITAQASVRF